jgi:hypothetical protein
MAPVIADRGIAGDDLPRNRGKEANGEGGQKLHGSLAPPRSNLSSPTRDGKILSPPGAATVGGVKREGKS